VAERAQRRHEQGVEHAQLTPADDHGHIGISCLEQRPTQHHEIGARARLDRR